MAINESHQNICRYLLYLLCYSTFTVKGSLTDWPRNTEAIVGQAVRLPCSTSEPYVVTWEHVPRGSRSKVFVYAGGDIVAPYDSRFKVIRTEEKPGEYDLHILSVLKQDSGKYRCIDMEGQGERREAELIVLGSTPVCYCEEIIGENSCGIQQPDEAEVTCQVSYSGNVAPFFTCPGMNDTIYVKNEIETESVRYVLVFKADLAMINYYHTCYTHISNIPSTRFKANVTYVQAQRKQVVIHASGRVTCALNSSRACRYKWVRGDSNNETVSNSQALFVKEPGTYRCEADCVLGGVSCKLQPVEIIYLNSKDSVTEDESSLWITVVWITVVVVAAVVICAVLFVVCFINRQKILNVITRLHSKRKNNEGKPKDTPQVEMPLVTNREDKVQVDQNINIPD